MKVRFTARAAADLDRILEYIGARSRIGASNVREAFERTLDVVARFPEAGRLAGEQETRVVRVRRYPYLVYWSVEAGEAWVVHIRHAARQRWHPGQSDMQ